MQYFVPGAYISCCTSRCMLLENYCALKSCHILNRCTSRSSDNCLVLFLLKITISCHTFKNRYSLRGCITKYMHRPRRCMSIRKAPYLVSGVNPQSSIPRLGCQETNAVLVLHHQADSLPRCASVSTQSRRVGARQNHMRSVRPAVNRAWPAIATWDQLGAERVC